MAISTLVLPEPGQLRLFIETEHPVHASDLGTLLRNLDRAFSRFARERYGARGVHLGLAQTGTSSWWALFEAISGMYELGKHHPDLVGAFSNDISYVTKVLREHGPEDTPQYIRGLIQDMIKAARSTGASAIQIAGTVAIDISQDEYSSLSETIKTHGRNASLSAAALTGPPRVPQLTYSKSIAVAGAQASKGQLFATLHKVAKTWYARTQGMYGVLIPLDLPEYLKWSLLDGKAYQIEGDVLKGPEGYPVGIMARSLTHLK